MSSKINILVYAKMQSVQYRIQEIINSINLTSNSFATKVEFIAIFKKLRNQIDLVVLDISSNNDSIRCLKLTVSK